MKSGKSGTRVVRCPQCGRYYRLAGRAGLRPGTKLRCTKCGHVFPLEPAASLVPPPTGPRVLVASDGEEVTALIEEILMAGGFVPRSVKGGDEAWDEIRRWKPRAVVLDVGLPGIPVFEVCHRVRQDPLHHSVAVVLLASVYRGTRYKRAPTSLYGADDYIEKHHLRDSLADKITRLLPEKKTAGAGVYPPPNREEQTRPRETLPSPAEARRDEEMLVREEQFGPGVDREGEGLPPRESLRRFARIILSDIALYNQETVERGIRQGSLHQLLAREIAEGRQLFETRLPPGAGGEREFYDQALADFIRKQQARFREGSAG
jgi:DNA-binding response OmpR family regulator